MAKKRLSAPIRNQSGQLVIEAVLLLVVTVGLFALGSKQLRDNKILAAFIGKPWAKVSGMIESGVWEDASKARASHPNQNNRFNTVDPR